MAWGGAPNHGCPHGSQLRAGSRGVLWAFKSSANGECWAVTRLGCDWLANSLYGGIYSGLPHIGFIAKVRGLEKGGGYLRCSEFGIEGGIWGRYGKFLFVGRASKVYPSCPEARIFLKKAGGCGSPDKIEKASNCLASKAVGGVGTKILGLHFIFNSKKKLGVICHLNLGIEET